MAFSVRNLSVLAYAQGFTQWHYKLSYDESPYVDLGYFNNAFDMFTTGDIIIVSGSQGAEFYCVNLSEGEGIVNLFYVS